LTLSAGTRLGPYEVLSPLGAGGMGEVYRARDTRLDREVAVKVLPTHLSDNPEFRQRFEREARAISQLSHPNICALYDVGNQDGVEYLVMELLEGQSLAERLEKGPLATDLVLKFGVQIADALDKAHRQGIVHRDLKPGNVMLTKSGVKLLDFGLAKLRASTVSREISELSSLPTELSPSRPLTEQGTIMGTFQYMAPEQLEGKDADARSDIFAFGCVLYEMATGRKAFTGKSRASMIAAILEHDPAPISSIAPMTPPALDRVVKTCLAKDPEDRWQSAHDVKSELQWIAEAGSQAGAPAAVVSRRKNRERTAWLIAGLFVVAAFLGWYRAISAPRILPRAARLTLEKPENAPFEYFDSLAPSPDGKLVAFVAHTADEKRSLWVRPIDSLDARSLPGSDDAQYPFWSPDSRFLAFFAGGKLKKVDARGGPPEILCGVPEVSGGAWGSKGVIVFGRWDQDGIWKVPAKGGTPSKLTSLAPDEEAHRWPAFLPDGDHFVFLVDANQTEGHWLALSSISDGKVTRLAHAISNFAVSPDGHIFYVRSGTLVAQPFDTRSLRLSGEPSPVGENVAETAQNHRFDFGVSGNGLLVYLTADPNLQFVWFDRSGKRLEKVGEPLRVRNFDLSPDGSRVAFERLDADGRNANLWTLDLARGFTTRVTMDAAMDFTPAWTPDSRSIVFVSSRDGYAFYETSSAGGGEDRLLLKLPTADSACSISPDGRTLIVATLEPRAKDDLWLLPLGANAQPAPFRRTPFSEFHAQFSPDGRWVAFAADDSGRPEVYVRSLSDPSAQWRISSSGGVRPRWRGDGKELFFFAGSNLMAATVSADSGFHSDDPRPLFSAHVWSDYAPSRDGQRFLLATSAHETFERAIAVLDWKEGLRKP